MKIISKEVSRFLVAGFSAVGTDAGSYSILLNWLEEPVAKGCSFILGSIVAFVANKFWTFESKPLDYREMVSFSILYLTTLMLNVSVNQLVLTFFPLYLSLAFLMATGTSTVLNFLGMKYWVFNKIKRKDYAA